MQTTLIDPFEVNAPPPMRAPMPTMSIDIELDGWDMQDLETTRSINGSQPDIAPDSWGRVRCWCSED